MSDVLIRDSVSEDMGSLDGLYSDAFPDEDLRALVRTLLGDPNALASRVAVCGAELIGHVIFTECRLNDVSIRPVLLGPLAVAPRQQRRGVGSRLVRDGLTRLEAAGVTHVFVLGDPGYYARFGFEVETRVAPPYPLPEEWRAAWRSKSLVSTTVAPQGVLQTPTPWNDPAFWAP